MLIREQVRKNRGNMGTGGNFGREQRLRWETLILGESKPLSYKKLRHHLERGVLL